MLRENRSQKLRFHGEREIAQPKSSLHFPTGPVEKTIPEHPTCQTSKQGEEKKGARMHTRAESRQSFCARPAHCDLHGSVFLPSVARSEIGEVRRRDVVFAAGPFPRWCSLEHTPATTTCYEVCGAHSLSLASAGERGAA
jgi:hypothetical protein